MNQVLLSRIMLISIILISSRIYFEFNKKIKKSRKKKTEKFLKIRLFLSFDPKSRINFPFIEMNWIIIIFVFLFLYITQFPFPSRNKILNTLLFKEISEQLKIAIKRQNDRRKIIFISIFTFIIFSNLIGLIPNSFTSTRHITLNLFISLPLWVGFFLYGWKAYTKKIFSHLVPSGTPIPLIRFIVIIELIRTSIRPFTLGIRLIANIVSGHLLLTLIGNTIRSQNKILIIIISLVQLILSSLEFGVGIIQAYVFTILLTLYSDDSDYSK